MKKQIRQIPLLKKEKSDFGGELFTTRKERLRHRPLAQKSSMHLVLRSSVANGKYAFTTQQNRQIVSEDINKFAKRNYVKVLSCAIVGNHIHLHIKLFKIRFYEPFIRGLTASLALKISGASKNVSIKSIFGRRFWDYRPFTRIVGSFREFLNLRDYIRVNQWEGHGVSRAMSYMLVSRGEFVGFG